MNERGVFEAALELLPENRDAYLDRICGDDEGLRRRLEVLLSKHGQADSFLESPVAGFGMRDEARGEIDSPSPLDPFLGEGVTADADERTLPERPGAVIGPYKLLEQIGEGGFGIVFMAEQQQPIRRKVALKVLKPGMDTRQVIA